MFSIKLFKIHLNFRITLFLIFLSTALFAQDVRKEKMSQLNMLVGEWIGQSTTYKNGEIVKTVPAYEKISYGLDGHILTVDLDSEALQLHTVIYYDVIDETFYYNPFYKTGSAKYRAEFKDGQLIVWPTETKRFVFGINEDRQFVEYGETLQNSVWTIYFKDVFKRTE